MKDEEGELYVPSGPPRPAGWYSED